MKQVLYITIYLLQASFGFEYPPERIQEMEKGLQEWHEMATNPETIPEAERIETLALGLRKTSNPNIYALENRREVMEEVRTALLNIPGHADQVAGPVREAASKLKRASDANEAGPLEVNLNNAQIYCFQTLGLLPSAETVRVLGEFLYDEEGRVSPTPPGQPDNRSARQYETGRSPNAMYALRAIAKLPIVSPPVQRRKNNFVIYDDDINSWRLWYEQVKAGTRTFQFEGDPTEYTLAGPVQAKPSSTATTSRAKARPPELSPETDGDHRGFPWPILASALALLAGGAWAAITRRKPAR